MIKKNTFLNFSVVILAAGKSSRMGVPKFSLKYSDKVTFLDQIVSEFNRFEKPEIRVVVNENDFKIHEKYFSKFEKNVRLVVNNKPQFGRLYSLKLGLENCQTNLPVFMVNVDNPFVNNQLINELLENLEHFDWVVPMYRGKGGHPVLIHNKIAQTIVSSPMENLNLKSFLNQFSKKMFETNDYNILININTKEEYNNFFRK